MENLVLGWKSVTALFLAAIFRVTLVLLALLSLAKIRAYMPTVNNNNNFYHASMNFFEINKEKKTIFCKRQLLLMTKLQRLTCTDIDTLQFLISALPYNHPGVNFIKVLHL